MDQGSARAGGTASAEAPRATRSLLGRLEAQRGWPFAWHAALFLMLTCFVAADLAADLSSGTTLLHVSLELIALGIALAGVVAAALQLRDASGRARHLEEHLEGARADVDRWRSEAQLLLQGLGTAIDRQFERWGLTAAEAEVALLVLKGLSYKDVAAVRGTAERTIRHQALAIYRKAGLTGRAEMAAFFLEDLLLPPHAAGGEPAGAPLNRCG